MKKIILVTGATGAQGGSVARALLAQNKFRVRILTRNAGSEKSLELMESGAQIAQGDMNDSESLQLAMKDCYGVFGVTNFWEHFDTEYTHGKNLIDAVANSGINHFVFHTLPNYQQLSNGKFAVPHCDIKAALQNYTTQLGLPATFVHLAFYYENFFNFFPLQPDGKDSYQFGFPQGETKLAMASVEDLGGVVATIFDNAEIYTGRTVGVVGDDESCHTYARIMTHVLQKNIQYRYIPREVFAGFNFPGAEELANMFEVQRLHILNRRQDLVESYAMNSDMQSFEKWLTKNKSRFDSYFQLVSDRREITV